MSKIMMVNGETTTPIDYLPPGGASRYMSLAASEDTLTMTLPSEYAALVNDNTTFTYSDHAGTQNNDQIYKIASYNRSVSGQAAECHVECEAASYALSEMKLDSFIYVTTGIELLFAELMSRIGSPYVAGTFEPRSLSSDTYNYYAVGTTAREQLLTILSNKLAGLDIIAPPKNADFIFNGYTVNAYNHRGVTTPIELTTSKNVASISMAHSVIDQTETYTVTLIKRDGLNVGDEVHIVDALLGINVYKRIASIRYNPYDETDVEIELGDARKDIINILTSVTPT